MHYDYNLIVIGGGSGGLVSSYMAAALQAKVLLIEKHKMGGDCLNTGCVPSKALLQTAKRIHEIKNASDLGIKKSECEFDFSDVFKRIHSVIKKIEPHDSVDRYKKLGVECLQGEAQFKDLHSVEVNGKTYTAKAFIIATGASPFVPPIKGLEYVNYLTSDNIWELDTKPEHLVILGGGPIGTELSQGFNRLGVHVTQVEQAPFIMNREDEEVSQFITQKLKKEGVNVLCNTRAVEIKKEGNQNLLITESNNQNKSIPFSHILFAVGRKASVSGFGLEKIGVKLTQRKTIETNHFMATNHSHIYACGDVTGPYQFTHSAAYQGTLASIHALFSPLTRLFMKANYSGMPWVTYTDPEVAHCGLSESMAKAQNIPYEAHRFDLKELDRAITESHEEGFIKILTAKKKDKILGVTAVGSNAGNWIGEFILAIQQGIGLNAILNTTHPYPTMIEACKYVAGTWKRNQTSPQVLKWLKKFHNFRR